MNIPPSNLSSKVGEFIIYYYHPFILQTKNKLEGRRALSYYDSRSSSFNGPGDVKVDVPSFRAKAIYEHRESKYLDRIETEVSRGLYVFGASIGPSSNNNPALDYTKLYYYIAHAQMFSKSFSLLVDSMGQYAFNPLVPVEKIPYGGFPFGRAYDPAEIIGDHGIL